MATPKADKNKDNEPIDIMRTCPQNSKCQAATFDMRWPLCDDKRCAVWIYGGPGVTAYRKTVEGEV